MANEKIVEISMVSLPVEIFQGFREELLGKHTEDDVEQIFYYAGVKTGIALVEKSGTKLQDGETLADALQALWWEIGFGKLFFKNMDDFMVYVEGKESAEAQASSKSKKRICHFTRGYLAGITQKLTGKKYFCTEETCIAEGASSCTYMLGCEEF